MWQAVENESKSNIVENRAAISSSFNYILIKIKQRNVLD